MRRITTGLWPGFPSDLVSLVTVLATQADGRTLVHDWLYELRLFALEQMSAMRADLFLCDPHRIIVSGPTRLRGRVLDSRDLRSGMALIAAALAAEGESRVTPLETVERGYASLIERLRSLGAQVERVDGYSRVAVRCVSRNYDRNCDGDPPPGFLERRSADASSDSPRHAGFPAAAAGTAAAPGSGAGAAAGTAAARGPVGRGGCGADAATPAGRRVRRVRGGAAPSSSPSEACPPSRPSLNGRRSASVRSSTRTMCGVSVRMMSVCCVSW